MRELLPFMALYKQAAFRLIFGVILMICGLAASVGLLTLSGWFLAATALAGANITFNFFYPSAGVRGLAIGRTAARYFERVVTHDGTFRILAKLRVKVFERLIPLSPGVLSQYKSGELLNRLVADVDTLDGLYLRLIAPFISGLMITLFLFLGLNLINTQLALIIALTLVVLMFVVPFIFYSLGKNFGAELTQLRAQYRVRFIGWLEHHAELRLFAKTKSERDKLEDNEGQWQKLQKKEATLSGLSNAILLVANGALICAILWLAGNTTFTQGEYPYALIALFGFTALASFEILMSIGGSFLQLGQIIASAQRVNEIINRKPLVEFLHDCSFDTQNGEPLIEVDNLSFYYPNTQRAVLKSLNLTINEGDNIAILGKTGSGKSSLLQLLVRNYDADSGNLRLAKQDIQLYSEETLRKQMIMLTQQIYIFSDTLRKNLLIANPKCNDSELLSILGKVGLSSLANSEDGLDIWLGDGGRPLSGGEQRRLGLARVLLSDKPLILLDEPTEGLDRETESFILQHILQHSCNKTLIMVTHRLNSLEKFDKICVMDDGELVEQGSYQALLSQTDSLFSQLVNRV